MKIRLILFTILVSSALLLQACGPETASLIATGIAQTQQIAELQTAAAGGQSAADNPDQAPQASDTPAAPTETPTVTLTPTSSVPYVSVSVETHCRSGPRIDYPNLTDILVGEKVIVLATYPYADYVIVQRENGAGSCWLWLKYADQQDFSGYNLPIATQPPTSTFTFTPSPTYTPSQTPTPTP